MATGYVPGRSLVDRVRTREARIGVIGLGYAGLPLALEFAKAGYPVVAIDVDEQRVEMVNAREPYLVDVPAEGYEGIEGTLEATTDYAAIEQLDAVAICVPTPLSKTRTPDLSSVVSAATSVARHVQPEQLVILQSTTYPGTTEDVVLPILEARGGRVGRDFFLGYAPERADPGNRTWNLRNTPKLVAGITPECRARTELVYRIVVDDVVPVSSTTVAETAKLHENTFRAVNIALANELALMCDRLGISVDEVIDAASTKPFAFMPHFPGPGLGGDCIPVVPHFLSWRLREYGYSTRLIDAAHEINAHMPTHVVQKITEALNDRGLAVKGSRVLLLGMAYKANVNDTRESPSVEIMRQLEARGAEVRYADPLVPVVDVDGDPRYRVDWSEEEAGSADCLVMLTPHREFLDEPHWRHAGMIVDTRNVLPAGEHTWRI